MEAKTDRHNDCIKGTLKEQLLYNHFLIFQELSHIACGLFRWYNNHWKKEAYEDGIYMGKRIWGLFSGILCAAALMGCGAAEEPALEDEELQKVELVVWGAEEDTELMNQIIQSFQINYQGQADFQISFAVQGESQCKDVLLGGLEDGADVFTFADDQLNALAAAGALDPIGNADEIMDRNLSSTVEAAMVNDRLYAYPLTADNGYFLYYNKRYITEEQVKTLDGILEAAAANDKLFTMDWSSAWYVYSFFGNTGLQVGLNDDGITNYCKIGRAHV